MIKDEPSQSLYIKLKRSVIPPHWYNDPDSLSLDSYFNPVDEASITPLLKSEFGMPNPIPVIIKQQREGYWLIAGGDGKHYLWEYFEGSILEVYERDLAKILAMLRRHWSIGGTTLKSISIVESGVVDFSCSMGLRASNGT